MQHTGFLSIIVKLIGYLLLAGYLYGCGLVVRPKVSFVVKNKSTYRVDISFFKDTDLLKSVPILSGSAFDTTFVEELGSVTLSPFPQETDSISVSFEGKKAIVLYCNSERLYYNYEECQFPKNLMDFATGEVANEKRKYTTTKVITFDNSDYERAVEL